jgi:hypothetical protein
MELRPLAKGTMRKSQNPSLNFFKQTIALSTTLLLISPGLVVAETLADVMIFICWSKHADN